ncbi:MAG: hypothetical protein GY855_16040, partial [candidate division Zixibacteria bacterium]|nr:hypothetical protein [candidate division Zixibacteria bacterium]
MRCKSVVIFIFVLSSIIYGVSDCFASYELIGVIENNGEAFCPFFSLGDVNNDGYSDYAITRGPHDYSYVDVYLGGENPDFNPVVTLHGDTLSLYNRNGSFGHVAAGDLNGDGYSDVIVSASLYSIRYEESWEGKAYVFFGGEVMDSIPDVILTNERLGERYGSDIACSDFNNDGIDDLVVYCRGSHNVGPCPRFYIYYGAEDYEPDLFWDGEHHAVDFRQMQVGDINGDG